MTTPASFAARIVRALPCLYAGVWLLGCTADGDATATPPPRPWSDGAVEDLSDAAEVEAAPDGGTREGGDELDDLPDGAKDSGEQDSGPPPLIETVASLSGGVSARVAFEDAYDNVNSGDWYRGQDNESAVLAWGESYVMMSLAAMFRATGSPQYLDRLAMHADSTLAQRDDHRGVTDYRGVSGPCWRNTGYQTNGEAYCYAVHSGMIASPMVEFALLVRQGGLDAERAYDGVTFGQKAEDYIEAAEQTAAGHDDEWNDAGYYIFRADATFLTNAGKDLPLNQSNAMGRLLLLLHDATSKAAYLDKATKLAQRLKSQMTVGANGEYLWNYWGGAYASPGEDISHAALNVEFATLAADRGVVFTSADIDRLTHTFLGDVYLDDGTFSDFVGGGTTNGSGYRPQAARWLPLSAKRTSIYAAIRDLYEQDYHAADVGSGSLLLGWAWLALYEPIHRPAFFYSVDWTPADASGWRQATAYGANVLTTPLDLNRPSVVTLPVSIPRQTVIAQWDGAAYHALLSWRPTGGAAVRWVGYEQQWPFVYWNGGVLFELEDAFVDGQGLEVKEMAIPAEPVITSTPPLHAVAGVPYAYVTEGTGGDPRWWALTTFPAQARIDWQTGVVAWTPPGPGTYPWTIRLQTDYGGVEQTFVVQVP